jgi:anti-sigma-K factor RskA
MMATEHEHWRERSDIYALGALDGEELKNFQAHLASECPACEAYVLDTRETLNLLHRSLRPMTPPAAVKARILCQIDNDAALSIAAKAPARVYLWRRMAGTLAAAIAGVVVAGSYFHFRYEPRHTVYSAVVHLLRDPSTRDLPLHGAGPTPRAKGRFLWNESGEGHIFVTDLPAAPAGKVYAVWTIARNSAPRYVGTITTDAVGQGGLHISTARGKRKIDTFAVTLEPDGTTAAPTGPMVLVSKQS